MNILVVGGTRYFGKYTIEELVKHGHHVTVATRGNAKDNFGDSVERVVLDRAKGDTVKAALDGREFDCIIDKIAYGSNDIPPVLDNVKTKRYVQMSTTSVYVKKHFDTVEEEFNPSDNELIWCSRNDYDYGETKRQAETCIVKKYGDIPSAMVRYPFVIGEDDYSKRLLMYIKNVNEQKPMFIDNLNEQLGFIRSDEAGKFIAYLAENEFTGPVNGSSHGTISLFEILEYVSKKIGKKYILADDGEPMPYNGETEYSINTDKAESLGFRFTELKEWIFNLIDYYIASLND